MAGMPSAVPGILMNRFGRSIRFQNRGAAATDAAVSLAMLGGSSNETKPSTWPVSS